MFSIYAKILKRLSRNPKANIIIFLALALFCIYPINNLRWEIQLQDSLKGNDTQLDYAAIEKAFGGLGSLTIVLKSDDSLSNFKLAERFAQDFSKDTLVHFIEYAADEEFFKRNRLLYASDNDVYQVLNMVDSVKQEMTLESNPFLVDLTDNEGVDSSAKADDSSAVKDGIVSQIEAKYFQNLQQSFANKDGSIRVIDVYPTHSLTDLKSNRELYNRVHHYMDSCTAQNGAQTYYTGKVYSSIQTGKTLLPEVKHAGILAAIIILVLLVIHFFRNPRLIFIAGIPIALPTVFMFGIAYLLFGRINLFTLNLALLLPGHACQIQTHVFSRYFQERLKRLSPTLCTESAILGVVPPVAASSLVMAALFASLFIIPLPGLRELAILGSIGSLMNLFVCPLMSFSLLQRAQERHKIGIPKFAFHFPRRMKLFPNKVNWAIIIVVSVISGFGLIYSGTNLSFIYDFKQTELKTSDEHAQELIRETGFSTYDPIIIMLPDSAANKQLLENFEQLQRKGSIPDLGRLYTQYQFLPKMSHNKRSMLSLLKEDLTPEVLAHLGAKDSLAIAQMFQSYEEDLRDFELSENIRRKFSSNNGKSGIFAFIIPSTDPDNGLTSRHINTQLNLLDGIRNREFKVCGTPVLRANVLDLVLSNVDKSIFAGTILLWVILLLYYNKLSRAFFTMLPSMFSMSWLTILIYGWGIHISFYSSLAFVLLIGASVDGSLQLWSAYYEKQNGTAWTVLHMELSSILISQVAAFIGAITLLLSSHPGIRSIGVICVIGFICIFVAQFTIYPLIASTLDTYRVIKKSRQRHESTLQ